MEIKTLTDGHWTERLNNEIVAKAAQAGCDISDLEMTYCDIERTWGDKVGVVFTGTHAERAALFAAKWCAKNINGSYDQQNVAGYCGVGTVYVGSGRSITGHIVSAVYYPCAD